MMNPLIVRRCLLVVVLFFSFKTLGGESPVETYRLLNTFNEAFDVVRQEARMPLSDKKLIESAVQGMVSSVDSFSYYISAEHYKNMMTDMQGELQGVGLELMKKSGKALVVTPLEGSPAWHSGIKSGDYILEINGHKTQELSLHEIGQLIRGEPGGMVHLKVQHPSHNQSRTHAFSVSLKRQKILLENIRWEMQGSVAYVRIANFHSKTTVKNLQKVLKKILLKKPQGLIIDLRNNPGGLLEEVVGCLNFFLSDGVFVKVESRASGKAKVYRGTGRALIHSLPMVVLINKGTASCAEIMAGCLQDHGRALILGVTSFGKGTVQSIFPLSSGGAAIALTVAKYLTPSGKDIDGSGIQPDVLLDQKSDIGKCDTQKEAALTFLKTRGIQNAS